MRKENLASTLVTAWHHAKLRHVEITGQISPPRAWAEIDRDALRHNLEVAKCIWPGMAMMAVVKAGAYGHGLEEVARVFVHAGVAFLGVANVGEARRIAQAGINCRIYLLGATWSEERREIVEREWTPCISSMAEARHFDALARSLGKRLKVHLAVDTGMGRGGFVLEQLPEIWSELRECGGLLVEGLGSHLPSADEDEEFTRQQFSQFNKIIDQLGGVATFAWRHLANSAGLLGYDPLQCNLARPGLMLYGISPLANFQEKLRPAMTLKSRVTLIRVLPAGHGVSYGRSYVTTRPTRVATIGMGYGDGYPRHVSGHAPRVFLRGQYFPILGRVTMDQMMIDVTEAPDVQEGDEVELFGPNLPVEEVAKKADTISWHILTGITARVVRRYVGAEQK
jgi:alanine racemase